MKAGISSFRNLGKHSETMLRKVGITSIDQLVEMGSVKTYLLVKEKGLRPSLNLLYAMEGALTGEHWTTVSKKERARLLTELDALISSREMIQSKS